MLSHFDKFQCDQRVLVVKLLRSFDQFPSDSVAECAEVPAGGLVNEALCWGGGRTVAAFKKHSHHHHHHHHPHPHPITSRFTVLDFIDFSVSMEGMPTGEI